MPTNSHNSPSKSTPRKQRRRKAVSLESYYVYDRLLPGMAMEQYTIVSCKMGCKCALCLEQFPLWLTESVSPSHEQDPPGVEPDTGTE